MNLIEKLKTLGEIEVPLSVVIMVVAVTVVLAGTPQKEVHYVVLDANSQKIHSL